MSKRIGGTLLRFSISWRKARRQKSGLVVEREKKLCTPGK